MGEQLILGAYSPLSEEAPELLGKETLVGPWSLTIRTADYMDLGEAHVNREAIGLVLGEAPELFEDVEDGAEIRMPSEKVLLTRARSRARYEGNGVLEPGSAEAEESMYQCYRDSTAQLTLRWENVEGAVRLLLNGDEYDPEDFSLVDLGHLGFVLVRWSGPGEQADPEASRPAAALIAPDRKPA